jgi:hypothetical protein
LRRDLAQSDASARPVDAVEAAAMEPSHLLVEIVGAGADQILVGAGTGDVLDTLARPGLVVWLVAGIGRVLPERLFAAMLGELVDVEDRGLELLDVQRVDRIAGPTGLVRTERLARLADCPVAPELLRLR